MKPLKNYTKKSPKGSFTNQYALKNLQTSNQLKLKIFINYSNYGNAENLVVTDCLPHVFHFPYSTYEIKRKAEKDFMTEKQSQNLIPTALNKKKGPKQRKLWMCQVFCLEKGTAVNL